MITASQVTEPRFILAEGPVWDELRQRALWVDIFGHLVLEGRLLDGQLSVETEHRFESYVGAVAVAEDGSLVIAGRRGLTRVAPDGSRTSTGPLDVVGADDRFNDGLCDARGRFLVGTLSLTDEHGSQLLLQVAPDGTTVLDDDLGLSNGLAFSPDGATLYSIDTVPGRVWRRDYDQATGATGERVLAFELSGDSPDGMTVDALGNLWLAIWGRGEVRCYTPSGELLDTVVVPAPHTSSVAFVGPDLDQMLVTTARSELTDAQLAEFPLSGSLFIADPGVAGLPTFPWSGHLPR